ncbi:MAG: hypothetical protein LBQ55_07990, partial [Treponema sp.]|nr:hypothetical protein [Treponema sp.]
MLSCLFGAAKAIPDEYRRTAEALFPRAGFPPGKGPTVEAACAFADILGIGADYRRLLSLDRGNDDMRHFMGHFQNNLDLLIQKTWVEKADEERKERLQDRIPAFIAIIDRDDFRSALEEFGAILEELAYLFFGPQSGKEDFTEYTFRIDIQMGLFWWYGTQLGSLRQVCACQKAGLSPADDQSLWAILLLGIC